MIETTIIILAIVQGILNLAFIWLFVLGWRIFKKQNSVNVVTSTALKTLIHLLEPRKKIEPTNTKSVANKKRKKKK